MQKWILTLSVACVTAACGGPPESPAPTPGERVDAIPESDRLFTGYRTEMDSLMVVINDQESLRSWWERATRSAPEPRSPVPTIDFTRHTVLLASGGRMNLGDRVVVESVGFRGQLEQGGGRSEVWFAVVRFTRDCDPLPGVRYPLQFVRVSKVEDLEFETIPPDGCGVPEPSRAPGIAGRR